MSNAFGFARPTNVVLRLLCWAVCTVGVAASAFNSGPAEEANWSKMGWGPGAAAAVLVAQLLLYKDSGSESINSSSSSPPTKKEK